MEFSAFTGFRPFSGVSLCPYRPSNSVLVFKKRSLHRRRKYDLSRSSCSCSCKLSSLRITATSANNGPADVDSEVNCDDFWGNSELVEVIGIGSRKEAVLDFCLESPFRFPSLRFWWANLFGNTIHCNLMLRTETRLCKLMFGHGCRHIPIQDSLKAQLQRRIRGKGPLLLAVLVVTNLRRNRFLKLHCVVELSHLSCKLYFACVLCQSHYIDACNFGGFLLVARV